MELFGKKKKIAGLSHSLLPQAEIKTFEIGARFVDQAIQSLLVLMKISPLDFMNTEVFIAGGGNMTMPEKTDKKKLIGNQNLNTAKQELLSRGLKKFKILKIYLKTRDKQ